jgi:hypothetical protein
VRIVPRTIALVATLASSATAQPPRAASAVRVGPAAALDARSADAADDSVSRPGPRRRAPLVGAPSSALDAALATRHGARRAGTVHGGLHRQRPALIGGALVGTAAALAQGSTMRACLATRPWTVPNADLSLRMWDGFCAPRWAHHLLRASASLAAAGGAMMALPDSGALSADVVAGAATVVTGIAPHLVGYATGAYRFQAGDFLADAWISAAPLVVVQYRRGWRRGALATAAYAAGYLLLAPYASP